jgi:catechol 2,3-dioxygenase-like lactoylglutathione lyase family enzyme
MEQRVSLITLGVSDLQRARKFYEQLGWQGQEVEETVFFQAGGIVFTLWDREKLALDSGIADSRGGAFSGVVLAHNVRTEDEVGQVLAAAESAGAKVTRQPSATFYGGYAGYFSDPDGYLWEIAFNPGFTLADDGSMKLPDLSLPPS